MGHKLALLRMLLPWFQGQMFEAPLNMQETISNIQIGQEFSCLSQRGSR